MQACVSAFDGLHGLRCVEYGLALTLQCGSGQFVYIIPLSPETNSNTQNSDFCRDDVTLLSS